MDNLTPEQKREVFYEGGLRETVTLAGCKIKLGELALRDRYKLFECLEGDLAQVEKTWHEYIGSHAHGLIGFMIRIFKNVIGLPEKRTHAISVMKKYIQELTENDIRLIQLCAASNNDLTPAQIREFILSAPYTEEQRAIQKALEVNGIDVKKFQAARQTPIPTEAAPKTTISTAGSAE